VDINGLINKTIICISDSNFKKHELILICENGRSYQSEIEAIHGDLSNLIDTKILKADCIIDSACNCIFCEFTTDKGSVIIRFCGVRDNLQERKLMMEGL